MKKRYLIVIILMGITHIVIGYYLFIYHPEIKKGDVWGFYVDKENPFQKPDSVIWGIDEIKDGWVKTHYLPIEDKPHYNYDNELYLYKSWTKFK